MDRARTPAVAIVILNWNNATDTLACLASVAQLDYPAYRTLVVDNGSTDGSVATIRAAYPEVELLETGENLGYAGGNNVGIRHALAQGVDYILVLNNDVTLAPDSLSRLVAVAEGEPQVGVVSPLVAEMASPERVWALGAQVNRRNAQVSRRYATAATSTVMALAPHAVDAASGAAMLIRGAALQQVGLLDERFFLYYEEVDWCLQVAKAGWGIWVVPSALAWHKVSATLGPTSPRVDYYMLRNRLHLVLWRWPIPSRWTLMGRILLRELLTILAFTLKPHRGARLPHRNARLLALRDALLGRWGRMGPDVERVCHQS